ncbi:hypothetical protein WDW86_04080 [Bdellovibrionota bacterium FG-2]
MTKTSTMRLALIIGLWINLVSLAGCGSGILGGKGGTLTPNVISGVTPAAALSLMSKAVTLSALDEEESPFRDFFEVAGYMPYAATETAGTVGATTATSLKSLKYFIQSIQLCQSMTITGSAYSNASGCIDLYTGPVSNSDTSLYNSYTITEALADTDTTHWIDLMSATDQAKLKKGITVTLAMKGAYKYGKIDFFRPIKTTAEFPLVGGGTYYSKASTVVARANNEMGMQVESASVGDMTTGPAEETVYMMNNGGVWFPFLKDFEITDDDIKNQTSVSMDLVFNPADFGKASKAGGTCNPEGDNTNAFIYDKANCITMNMPYVRMNPVPRKGGEKTYKETYLIEYGTGTSDSQVRLELYYVNADSEKSIRGVDSTVVLGAGATTEPGNVIGGYYVNQTGTIAANNATVEIQDYQKSPVLTGLVRRTNGTATITCSYMGGPCTTAGATISKAYTYVGETLVSSD